MFLTIDKLINCEKDLIPSQSNHEETNLHNSSQTSWRSYLLLLNQISVGNMNPLINPLNHK